MNILIVEDEPLAQQEIKRLLSKVVPEAVIVGILDSVEDTVSWLQANPAPDMAFLDIELSDGSSFDIFERVDFKSPVVFTTAYNEYAIKAFKLNSIDYLLKPIDEEGLKASVAKLDQVKTYYQGKENQSVFTQEVIESIKALSQAKFKSRLMVSMSNDRIGYVDVDNIAYFYANDSTCFLVTFDKRQHIINYNLETLESILDPKRFFRLSRKYIAQVEAIVEVHKHFNSRLKVIVNPPVNDEILVSRVKVPDFLKWLES